jgi:RNA polymerase sigma-70 factor (ECF subfamily)
MNRTPENGIDVTGTPRTSWLLHQQPLLLQLFTDSAAASWGLSTDVFAAALDLSAKKHFPEQPDAPRLSQYFSTLHLQDLALACACAQRHPAAWDHFVSAFRAYLRSAAAAILRCPSDSPAARELADSLFADLYGLSDAPDRQSLFRYFHGRSSLKTWLRAVLAQRHIDSIRANRRFTELESGDGQSSRNLAPSPAARPAINPDTSAPLPDPHRPQLVSLFLSALEVALALLDPRDKERLRLYYAAEQTLAEIGRKLGEHESSISRNLERTRRELRHQVEQVLRKPSSTLDPRGSVPGLSEAQIALCFQYAAEPMTEDAPIDLERLLPQTQPAASRRPGKKL